jgi:DNA/RNA-binding domain of Phe-tRNA-synthetase-like protein
MIKIVPASNWPDILNQTRLGVILCDVKCEPASAELTRDLDDLITRTSLAYKLDEVNKIELIAETRKAYKLVGNDPNRYRPSADSLIRRIVKQMGLYRISNVVDALNLISVQTGYSIGGYNFERILGNTELGLGIPGEEYSGIGRGNLNITNLPVLRDSLGPFGSPTSDSVRTSIAGSTHRILLVFFDFWSNPILDESLARMRYYLERYCEAGDITVFKQDMN